jgi:hypothetical protein
MCRVQSAECRQRAQRRLWGPGPCRQLGLAGHGPPMPPKRHALAAPLAGVTSTDKLTLPLPRPCRFCCETFAELHPSFAVRCPIAPRLIASLLHCSIAPLLHCSIAPFHHHPFTRSLDRPPNPPNPLAHSLTHPFTRSPAHPLTHPRTHSVVSVSVSVPVSVPCLLLPPSLCFHTTTPRCSARLCSPPSPALAHAAPTLSHFHAPIGLAASGPALLFLGPHFFQPRLFSAPSAAFARARSLTRPSATNCCCTLHTTPNI